MGVNEITQSMCHWCNEMDMHYGWGFEPYPLPRNDFSYGGSTDCSAMGAHAANDGGWAIPRSCTSRNIRQELEKVGWWSEPANSRPSGACFCVSTENHVAWWDGSRIIEFGGDPHNGYSTTHGWYDYPWDYFVYAPESDSDGRSQSDSANTPIEPRYQFKNHESGWLGWCRGLCCEDGCGDDFAGMEGCWNYGLKVEDFPGWIEVKLQDGTITRELGEYDSPIIGITFYYETDTSQTNGQYYAAEYRAHCAGRDWLKWETDDNDGGAGDDSTPIDMLQLHLVEC